MNARSLPIAGAALVEMEPREDHRGMFCRWFCQRELKAFTGDREIVNINYSRTTEAGAIRGLHVQRPPSAEMKLVRCLKGRVFDVMVDLRSGSKSFLQWYGAELSGENMHMLIIPEGVAHGFQVLEPNAEMLYLHTAFYAQADESGIRYDDPRIGIEWPRDVADISARDQQHPLLDEHYRGISI